MADNTTIRDGDNVAKTVATDELSDGAFAPKVQLLDGTTSPVPVSPATSGGQATQLTQQTAINTVLGVKGDAKSIATDATAISAMSVWKQISASVQLLVFGAGTAATAQRVTHASDDPAVATLGATTGAAVITDANGTIQQYLRGLVKRWADALGAGTAAAALRTTVASDDPLLALQAASSASITALASAATSAQLLAANAARKGLILNNTDANAVLVKYGTTASATSFTVRITQNGYWEMPRPIYTGRIDAIWEADGAGSLYATEL